MIETESTTRIIKKYPNRRLYDAHESLYITLEDLRQYVVNHIPFKVIDLKTEEDVTKASLIQIIFECEATQNPLFSNEILEQFVRFYDHPMQKMMKEYLEKSFGFFMQQYEKNKSSDIFADLNQMQHQTLENIQVWKHFMGQK